LSYKTRGYITKVVFAFGLRPKAKKNNVPSLKRFPGGQNGGIIFSADFELGWGWRYAKNIENGIKLAIEKAELARENFPRLLKLFDIFDIPVTWATVGHLFLSECNKGDHDWMRRIPYFENKNWIYSNGDWFDCDPYTNWEKAKTWYAPDLVELILLSKVNHEIASHTFSHIDFSDENCPAAVADDEMKGTAEAALKFGIDLKSMVFPGGTWGNIGILRKHGIKIYRKNIKFDLAYPFRDEWGLLVSPSSARIGQNEYGWDEQYHIRRIKKYIEKVQETGTIAHFWFHPSLDQWTLTNIFPKILEIIAKKRDSNSVWIGTMSEIADYINRQRIV